MSGENFRGVLSCRGAFNLQAYSLYPARRLRFPFSGWHERSEEGRVRGRCIAPIPLAAAQGRKSSLYAADMSALSRRGVFFIPWDSELCAGEMLRLAGCSSGWGVGARISDGGTARFYCGVLRSITPVFFPLLGKKKRLALCHVSIPRGRNRH